MLQKQSIQGSPQTPDKIKTQKVKMPNSIIELHQILIQEGLIESYHFHQQNTIRRSMLFRMKKGINKLCQFTLTLLQQFWKEIIPECFRGKIDSQDVQVVQDKEDKQRKCFEQYKKKKVRFFVIVFDDKCSPDDMQDAYERATFMTVEGRGIRVEDLVKQTNCANWKIKNWSRTKRYSILFFKFDLFGHLLYFGNLTKQLIDTNRQDDQYFDGFKNEITQVFQRYEQIQKQFVNSYMQKQDRMQFE